MLKLRSSLASTPSAIANVPEKPWNGVRASGAISSPRSALRIVLRDAAQIDAVQRAGHDFDVRAAIDAREQLASACAPCSADVESDLRAAFDIGEVDGVAEEAARVDIAEGHILHDARRAAARASISKRPRPEPP